MAEKLPCDALVTKTTETAAKYDTSKEAREAAEKDVTDAANTDCGSERETCIGHSEEHKILCKFTLASLTSTAKEVQVKPEPAEYKWQGIATITGKCECKKVEAK